MLTFNEIYSEVQEQVQDSDATTLVSIKRAINQGAQKFGAILNREWRNKEKTFSVVADQQYYQLPEDAIRLKSVRVTVGNIVYPLILVEDEDRWNEINLYSASETSDIPTHFFVKGSDQFGIYPIPSSNQSNGGKINYEPRMNSMSVDDYTTGTVTATNDDATIVGSGTTFTSAMVGRTILIEDGSKDHRAAYKIDTFTDGTNIEMENTWGGTTVAGASYRIGEVPDIPPEFHESLVDYACYRIYRRRRDIRDARDMKVAFDEALFLCQENYGSKTSSQYVRPARLRGGYVHNRRDRTIV